MIAPTLTQSLFERQVVDTLQPGSQPSNCPNITLAKGGVIKFNATHNITFDDHVVYQPNCTVVASNEPFYASTTVFIYVVATTTVISWVLLILLLINQRALDAERTPRSGGWLQGTAVRSAITGRNRIGGLGNRPWLQKVAVLLVTLGLTVASVETFRIAQIQHNLSIQSARWMRNHVVGSLEIRVLRVVSQIFVWLAQVQTLIRLFPRRKEKLIIKWLGFSLILCDLIFSCLNSFWINSRSLPRSYKDAIPALNYLFQLSINLLYAAWVCYYVATKRRYAFFKADELNMSIIGALSLTSIAIPVAFFIADIAVPPVAGWGDFFRWTGAAAASVVVWEWVERIEAMEREEKKDGILGREIFDEDELPTSEDPSGFHGGESSGSSSSTEKKKAASQSFGIIALRRVGTLKLQQKPVVASNDNFKPFAMFRRTRRSEERETNETLGNRVVVSDTPFRPPTPPNRLDTGSAGSTVYAVHYHPIQRTPPVDFTGAQTVGSENTARTLRRVLPERWRAQDGPAGLQTQKRPSDAPSVPPRAKIGTKSSSGWALAANAFKRRKRSPPLEIKKAMHQNADAANTENPPQGLFDFTARLFPFGAHKGDNTASQAPAGGKDGMALQHPTVIPAPPRGQTWSPDILRHSPNNLIQTSVHVNPNVAHRRQSGGQAQCSALQKPPQANGEPLSRPSLGTSPVSNLMPATSSAETQVNQNEQASSPTVEQAENPAARQSSEPSRTEDQVRQAAARASSPRERISNPDLMRPDPG